MALFLNHGAAPSPIEPLLRSAGVGDRVVVERCGCPPSLFTAEPHNGEMGTVVALVGEHALVDWGGTRLCPARRVRPRTG